MKLITIVGARPQFIKASVLSRLIKQEPDLKEVLVHTGQHFDENMSDVFFESMDIAQPDYQLEVNSMSHGAMTGAMLTKIEEVLIKENPNLVIVYGDTNSTLAGALAAQKLHIPVAHIEAGLRSFNMAMPEETNRIITDRISSLLFTPTSTAYENLKKEGYDNIDCEIIQSGDIMLDAALYYADISSKKAKLKFKLPEKFVLTTIHRAENTDNFARLESIVNALNKLHKEIPVLLPLHPRTKKMIDKFDLSLKVKTFSPVGYFEMIELLKKCSLVITDSGGLQKESYFFEKACLTLREETEWTELLSNGYNTLVDPLNEDLLIKVKETISNKLDFSIKLYGEGNAGNKILEAIKNRF